MVVESEVLKAQNCDLSKFSLPMHSSDRGVFVRRATEIRQDGGALQDFQATLEFLIDCRKMLTMLYSQVQQLIEDEDELVADVEEAADVFVAAEREGCEVVSGQDQGVAASKHERRSGSIKWQSDHEAPEADPSFLQL